MYCRKGKPPVDKPHGTGGHTWPQGSGIVKKKRKVTLPLFPKMLRLDYTQPVGLGRPAILQAPLPGPEGKSSYTSFSL